MRLLTVPNWSFGRNKILLRKFEEALNVSGLTVHYLQSDIDHNRTVSAFSGESSLVLSGLKELTDLAFDTIDLTRHQGAHPRIGALDVCPFLPLRDAESESTIDLNEGAQSAVIEFGEWIGDQWEVPVFLYERSARAGHESRLPALRKGGFGGLLDQQLESDYGPTAVHPRLGATVIGARGFLVAMNVNLDSPSPLAAQYIAQKIRKLRGEQNEPFRGVRALGFALPHREMSQVSLNITLPDFTPVDPIIEFIIDEASRRGVHFAGTELIGVIRPRDMEHATRLHPEPSQIVEGAL